MAKLLCSLLLAGFLLQANAFDFHYEDSDIPDSPMDWIKSMLPEDFVSQIKDIMPDDLISQIRGMLPDDLLSKIKGMLPDDLLSKMKGIFPDDFFSNLVSNFLSYINPLNYLGRIFSWLNPLNYLSYIGTLLNPLTYIKAFINFNNPFYWLRFIGIDIDPLHWMAKFIPNPFKWLPRGQDRCKLQVHRGESCKQPVERYYFDKNTNACMKFQYGGCGGNKNRFNDRRECEDTCRGH